MPRFSPFARVRSLRRIVGHAPTRTRGVVFAAAVLAAVALAAPAPGVTISFDYHDDAHPAFDPDGSKLRQIVTAAGQIWGDYLLDDRNYHFDLRYEDLDDDTLGEHQPGWILDSRDLVFDTHDKNGNLRDWFFDPTPFDNSEFSMSSTLVRDLTPQAADDAYGGSPPALLEAGFRGFALPGAASGKTDALTAVLHEMGHMFGFNFNFNDDDYDFKSSTIGGRDLSVNELSNYHGGVKEALMFKSLGTSERRLPSATDILALYDESAWVIQGPFGFNQVTYLETFDVPRVDFLGDESNRWNTGFNWIGGRVPDFDNDVFIRHGGLVLQTGVDKNSARSLVINEGSTLHVQGKKLEVLGITNIGDFVGNRGDLIVGNVSGEFATLQTDTLDIRNGTAHILTSTGNIDVDRNLTIRDNSKLMGAGVVRVGGSLINNGEINGGAFVLFGFSGGLSLVTQGVGVFNLDGDNERGSLSAMNGDLTFFGPVADAFDGTAAIGGAHTMKFSRPWGMKGQLDLRGGADEAQLATLAGDTVTIGGTVNVDGHAKISAPVVLIDPAVVNLPDANDVLILAGASTLRGGMFTGNGTLAISGATQVAMPDPLIPDTRGGGTGTRSEGIVLGLPPASIPTTYAMGVPLQVRSGGVMTADVSSLFLPRTTTMSGGLLTGAKTVNQVGDLMVDATSTINPARFLWGVDSLNHKTTLLSSTRLNLTPQTIARGGEENIYRGQIHLEPASTLHVDLGAVDSWQLAGSIDMHLAATVSGDNIVNVGEVRGDGFIDVARFENAGRVVAGRTFGGLRMPGADYVQTPAGVLEMSLTQGFFGNGAPLAVEAAQLAGALTLSWASSFNPAVGQEFDILKAGSIAGAFSSLSIVKPLGNAVTGDLLYLPGRVTFRITSSSPDPSRPTADFNEDGIVDGDDLALWNRAMQTKLDRDLALVADATGDGRIDGSDFLAWQRQLTRRATRTLTDVPARLAAIPEPSTAVMLLAGAVAALAGRGSRRILHA